MTEDFLEEYFESVATKVKDIGHTPESTAFYRISSKYDLDEFDNAVRNMQKDCCMLLEFGSGNLGESDSPKDSIKIGIHILNKTTEAFEDIRSARAAAKATLVKIIALMRKDCQDKFLYSDDSAGPLKLAGIIFAGAGTYDDMDGIDGNWYGKSLYIDFTAPVSQQYNPEDYL